MTTPDAMGLTPEAAQGYEDFFLPAIFHQWPPVLIEAADVSEGDDVLDLGCGTGVMARQLGPRVGATGSVTGVDLSDSMLGVARRQCPEATFHQGDAMDLSFEDASFDVVLSAFMLMFVPEPEKAIREMMRVLRPGGRLVLSVWRGLDDNDLYRHLVAATREVVGEDAAQAMAWPFIMGEHGQLEGLFACAETQNLTVSHHDGIATFPSVGELVRTEVQAWLLSQDMNEPQIAALTENLCARYPTVAGHSGDIQFPLNALVARGAKSQRN